MCYANEVAKEMEKLISKATLKNDLLRKQLSEHDKKISELYHFIEMSKNLSGSKGFATYRDLRELLRKRRLVKHELNALDVLFHIKRSNICEIIESATENIKRQETNFDDYTKNWGSHERINVVNTFDDVFEKEFQRQF